MVPHTFLVPGNKITAISPQRQIKNATEQFGVYGKDWGFKDIKFDYAIVEITGIVVFHGVFYFPNGEFPITSSISAYKDGARTKPDADFAKKVETDALTKALSKLGFNADVFMGMYDDHKYVQMMQAEFNKPEPKEYTAEQFKSEKESIVNAIRGGMPPSSVISELKAQGFIIGEPVRLEIESI